MRARLPVAIALAKSSYVGQTNSWRFLRDRVWEQEDVRDVSEEMRAADAF